MWTYVNTRNRKKTSSEDMYMANGTFGDPANELWTNARELCKTMSMTKQVPADPAAIASCPVTLELALLQAQRDPVCPSIAALLKIHLESVHYMHKNMVQPTGFWEVTAINN